MTREFHGDGAADPRSLQVAYGLAPQVVRDALKQLRAYDARPLPIWPSLTIMYP